LAAETLFILSKIVEPSLPLLRSTAGTAYVSHSINRLSGLLAVLNMILSHAIKTTVQALKSKIWGKITAFCSLSAAFFFTALKNSALLSYYFFFKRYLQWYKLYKEPS
jgi:hypothetical protein